MAFLDSKEEMLKIVLTEHGREKLSRGQFVVKYFSFSDDEVDYQPDISLTGTFVTASEEPPPAEPTVWDTIEALPNLVDYWDPARGVTLQTGVSAWESQIFGIVCSQSTAGQQPTYNATSSAASGIPSIAFTSSASQFLKSGTDTSLQSIFQSMNYLVIIAFKSNLDNTETFFYIGNDTTSDRVWALGGPPTPYFGIVIASGASSRQVNNNNAALSGADVWGYIRQNNLNNIYAGSRGATESSNTNATNLSFVSFDKVSIGSRNFAGAPGNYFDGEIYAILVFNTGSTANLNEITASLDTLMFG